MSFVDTKINMDIFDERKEAQAAVKVDINKFLEIIKQIDDDYVTESQDIQARINLVKAAAAKTSSLPSFRIKELENIIERAGRNQTHFMRIFPTITTK